MALGTDIQITHKFVSGKSDGADGTLVQPSKWNANENVGGGVDGQIAARDSVAIDGGSWVDPPMFHQGGATIKINSTTQLQLNVGQIPLKLANGWITRTITAAVTLSPTLTANTTFFLYAFDNAGVTTLEASTTGHVTDATFGVEVKSGDSTRTLVGMFRVNNTPALVDSGSQRFALSWFNRKAKISATATFATSVSTTSTTFAEIATALRAEFLCWADEEVLTVPFLFGNTSAQNGWFGVGIDGSTPTNPTAFAGAGNVAQAPALGNSLSLAEGYHFSTAVGKVVSGGTLNILGTTGLGDAAAFSVNRVRVKG